MFVIKPEGWTYAAIVELCTLINGKAFKPSDWTETGLQIIRIQNLNNPNARFNYFSGEVEAKFLVKKGELLFAWSGTPGTSFGAHIWNGEEAVLNQHIFRVLFNEKLINKVFFKLAINHKLQYLIAKAQGGVGLAHITKGKFEQTELPLPPLNEQRRIVAKIEALKARSQRVKDALEDIPQLLDQFRQSVLAAAFRGDLTADWREQNPDVEPASVLLERIRAERHRKCSEELYRKQKSASKVKNYEPSNPDINKLPQLPKSWIWVTLDQLLFSLRNGLSKPPTDELPGIPILRISSVRAMEVNINDIRYYRTENTDDLSNYFLETGDLLFTRYNGSRSFVGVCGIVPKIINDLLYPDKLIRGQLVDNSLSLPEYLELACNCGLSRSHIESHIKTSAGQQGIAGSDIKSMPIPLPPLAEQHTIVRAVKQEFAAMQNLASLTNDCLQDLQFLNQSILAKAFRGELVTQDPNDEPASVLLERIRAERTKLETKTAKKSTAKTSTRSTKKAQLQAEEVMQLELGLE